MIPKYVPILKAKKGEFEAYRKLRAEIKSHIIPVFDISKRPDTKKYKASLYPNQLYFNDITDEIHNVIINNSAMVDISRWAPNSTIENSEHILSYITDRLAKKGVDVIPVIGYERWEDDEYKAILQGLSGEFSKFCLRLDSYAFEDMIEEDHFYEVFNDIVDSLGLDCSLCNVILDFGDLTQGSIVETQDKIARSIDFLSTYDFKFISIAGCSVSTIINQMVPEENSSGLVVRKEWMAWKIAKKLNNNFPLIFGDYGITNPQQADGIIARDANGKIRYTIPDKYYVVRGYSKRKGEKGAQMYSLCRNLIESIHYKDKEFSWGDMRINECAEEKMKGNSTDWIAIDTNHHVTFSIQEIIEYERVLIVQKEREFEL